MAKSIIADPVLLEKAQSGDRKAFDLLCHPYYGLIFGHCLQRCRDASMAEDCTQETFLKAWRALPRFRGDSSLVHWLRVIATNVVSSSYRKTKVFLPLEEADFMMQTVSLDPEVEIDLDKAMKKLPLGARKVFWLYSILGMGHKEIAKATGSAEGTSKAQLHRARKLMSRFLNLEPVSA